MTVEDVIGMLGVLLVAVGLAFIYWPAALIVVGIAAVTISVLRARNG